MRRFLVGISLLIQPAIAGDMGAADLSTEQLASSIPAIGYKWDAYCGTRDTGKQCEVILGENGLVVDQAAAVPYNSILRTQRFNTWSSPGVERQSLIRLVRNDPAYTGWTEFKRGRIGGNVTWNTVLIEYSNSSGTKSVALFAFAENREPWQSFANTMRLIAFGARPVRP